MAHTLTYEEFLCHRVSRLNHIRMKDGVFTLNFDTDMQPWVKYEARNVDTGKRVYVEVRNTEKWGWHLCYYNEDGVYSHNVKFNPQDGYRVI